MFNFTQGRIALFIAICFSRLATASPEIKPEILLEGVYPTYPVVSPAPQFSADDVKKGEYLAKMGDCISCHTNMNTTQQPFAGGLPIKTPFGQIYSPNITPEKDTGIGDWSKDDFIKALKQGISPEGRHYFPVFPYLYFSNITDEDASALYAYFMSIPPIKQENHQQSFPFNMPGARSFVGVWNALYFNSNDSIEYNPAKSKEWNRGKYIVKGLGHCSMCHTPLNFLGAPKNKYFLTGAFVDGFWAPNITQYGLESASESDIAHVFSHHELLRSSGRVSGPMAEVNHNSLSLLNDDDRLAIATYLKTVKSQEPIRIERQDNLPSLKRGKQVYLNACAQCHQDNQMGAPVTGSAATWYTRLERSGLTGFYRHTIQGFNNMPIKGSCVLCSDNDLISAVDYILSQSLTPAQIQEIKKTGPKKYEPNGAIIYRENCGACHDEGRNGAPSLNNTEAWKIITNKYNVDELLDRAMKGRFHPENGGCKDCSTKEMKEAIKYMLTKAVPDKNFILW